jgi:hypothetical protein
MERQTILAVCLLTVLVSSWSAASAHASSVDYTIHDGKVSVQLLLQVYENASAIPNLSQEFTGAAAQDLSSAIEKNLKSIAENISISSLSGELRSSSDWVNASIRFDVNGVSSRSGNLLNVNCSWVRFKVTDDLRLGNVSYNLIGATYVRPAYEKYVDFPKPPLNETIQSVAYQLGHQDTEGSIAVQNAGNMTLLDFSKLLPAIENWNNMYNVTKGSTTWSYDLAPAADLMMMVVPIGGTPFAARAFYRYNATLSVDGLAQAQADTIKIDVSSGFEPLLMFVIVIIAFVIAVVTSWKYKSRRKQLPRRRK